MLQDYLFLLTDAVYTASRVYRQKRSGLHMPGHAFDKHGAIAAVNDAAINAQNTKVAVNVQYKTL